MISCKNNTFAKILMAMLEAKKRIEFIDLAKGVCIFLVVLLHMDLPIDEHIPLLRNLRMPLYFILSGLFFKTYGGWKFFFLKKVNKILIPFVFFYLVAYVIFYALQFVAPDMSHSEAKGIFDIFTQRKTFNNPIWFLLCLFWCNLLFCGVSVAIKKEWLRAVAVLCCGAVGVLLDCFDIVVYGCLDNAFSAMPFFYFGYLLKKTDLLYPNKYDKFNILFSAGLFCIASLLIYFVPSNIDFQENEFLGNILVASFASIAVVMAVLFMCKIFTHIPVVSYFGRYSIIVLCTHELVRKFAKPVLTKLGFEGPYVLALVVLLVCFGLIPLCVNFLPYVTAQKDVIKTDNFS